MKFKESDMLEALSHINIDISNHNISKKQLLKGMNIELEHGKINKITNITNDNALKTIKITLAHLLENPDYYILLKRIEGGKSHIQSIIFDKNIYNDDKINNFLNKHHYIPIKNPHITDKYIRIRLTPPSADPNKSYYTIKIKKGIKLIIMK